MPKTSVKIKADGSLIRNFRCHWVCSFILAHSVLLALVISKGSSYLWRLRNKKCKLKFLDETSFCPAASKTVDFCNHSSKSNEVLPGSSNNAVAILSENQSIVRERIHRTYSVYNFLVDHMASLLPLLGSVYALNWVGLRKAKWKDHRFWKIQHRKSRQIFYIDAGKITCFKGVNCVWSPFAWALHVIWYAPILQWKVYQDYFEP